MSKMFYSLVIRQAPWNTTLQKNTLFREKHYLEIHKLGYPHKYLFKKKSEVWIFSMKMASRAFH